MIIYKDIRDQIKSGDILLCSGNSPFSDLIKKATNSEWSHVGFIMRLDSIDRIVVLESVESIGVRSVPLSNYLYNHNGSGRGYPGKLMIARHEDLKEEKISDLSKQAVDLLGLPYGKDEILKISSRIIFHSLGLMHCPEELHNLKEMICSEYAYICYKSIGIEIPYNKMGFIAPGDFAKDPKVKMMFCIKD